MAILKYPIATACAFLWIGFVCAISFMEAWLKFRAPGINLPLGLGIGQIVFKALNKVEWVLAVAIIISIYLQDKMHADKKTFLFAAPFILLLIQTTWLLPALDARATAIIRQYPAQPSFLHLYYVIFEVVKVACLFWLGTILLKLSKYN